VTPVRIVIADDHRIFRSGLKGLLDADPEFRVVGEASDGVEAEVLVESLAPDILLLDLRMPRRNGIAVVESLAREARITRTIILTSQGLREQVRRALLIGVNGFLLKNVTRLPTLVEAIHAVHRGGRYLSPSVTTLILNDIFAKNREASPLAGLTQRERQVLRLIVDGKTSVQAAKELSLSPKTVETYRSRLTQKLGIHTLPELVKFAIQHGVTPL